MSDLTLPDDLAERIRKIAKQEHRSIEDVVSRMLQYYPARPEVETPNPDPLVGLIGLLDEYTSETDLSSTVRETLANYTHPQYGWTKRDRTD